MNKHMSEVTDLRNIQSNYADVNGIRLHYVDQGAGPAVIFCHGFPETWRSWSNQIAALVESGYRAIALDMRGHGGSSCPNDVDDYSVIHTVGDVIGLMDSLSIQKAVIVGHDAGTTTAYHAALMRPDRFYGVMALSIPFMPRARINMMNGMIENSPDNFYMRYFQSPSMPEKELDADPIATLRRIYFHNSGENPHGPSMMETNEFGAILPNLQAPAGDISFISNNELEQAAEDFRRTGFRGGLNGYRVFDRNWELTAPWVDMNLSVPVTYIGGEQDIVLHFPGFREAIAAMPNSEIVQAAGHWIQKEAPGAVNTHLLNFVLKVTSVTP